MLAVGLSVILIGCGGSAATPGSASYHGHGNQSPTHRHPRPPTTTLAPPTATATPLPTATPTSAPTATNTALPLPTKAPATATSSAAPSFTADIQPIFTARCIKCHSGDNAPRGLRMTSYDQVIAGGTYRPVIEPGSPADSRLVKRITGESTPRMPFDGPPFLSDDQIALIIAWVEAGAPGN